MPQTRKTSFVQEAALALGIAASGSTALAQAPQNTSWVQRQTSEFEQHFGALPFVDQHNNPIDLPARIGDGPVAVVYGLRDCKLCLGDDKDPGVADTVVGMQQQLLSKGIDMPFVFVSTNPEADITPEQREGWANSYYKRGLSQQIGETELPKNDKERAAAFANSTDQEKRRVHFVYPPTWKDAEKLQHDMGLRQNENKPEQHSLYVVVFDKGTQLKFADKTNPKIQLPGRSAIPLRGEKTIEAYHEHGKKLGDEIMQRLAQSKGRG